MCIQRAAERAREVAAALAVSVAPALVHAPRLVEEGDDIGVGPVGLGDAQSVLEDPDPVGDAVVPVEGVVGEDGDQEGGEVVHGGN